MLKLMVVVLVFLGVGAWVSMANAQQTYHYIDVYGNLRTEVAVSPAAAIAQAENIAPHSGVILATEYGNEVSNVNPVLDGDMEVYQYVDVFGNIRTEVALSPAAAIAQAENIAPHSGVMVVE